MTDVDNESRSIWMRSVLDQYEVPLTGYAMRITGDADAARDVVQETFLRLCSQDRCEVNGRLAPWLYTVCRSRALDAKRKSRRLAVVSEDRLDLCESGDRNPAVAAQARESGSRVVEAVALLPDNQQEVLRLRFTDGLSYKDIAAVTGLSVSNVGYLIHVAVKTIREKLNAQDNTR